MCVICMELTPPREFTDIKFSRLYVTLWEANGKTRGYEMSHACCRNVLSSHETLLEEK